MKISISCSLSLVVSVGYITFISRYKIPFLLISFALPVKLFNKVRLYSVYVSITLSSLSFIDLIDAFTSLALTRALGFSA